MYCSINYTFNACVYDRCPRYVDTCGKLPATLVLLEVLSPSASTFKTSFLSPCFPWCHAHENRYQALCVLHATENGAGLGTRLATCSVVDLKARLVSKEWSSPWGSSPWGSYPSCRDIQRSLSSPKSPWMICAITHIDQLPLWMICATTHVGQLPLWMIWPVSSLDDLASFLSGWFGQLPLWNITDQCVFTCLQTG